MDPKDEPLLIACTATAWGQIDALAAQIENPNTSYQFDTLGMAQAVIRDQMARARMIRDMIPEAARNKF